MSSQALELISALGQLPMFLKKFIDTVYALSVAFIQFFIVLEGSGIKKATTRAISRRLNSLHNGFSFSTAASAFTTHPDAHTSSLPGKPDIVYADYAGAPPYSISAVKAATAELLNGVWGNPHSDHGWENVGATTTASSSSAAADRLRELTLGMCQANSSEYVCILTSGATAALKLVADSFPWSQSKGEEGGGGGSGSRFLYLSDNHNSVLGIREVAASHGAHTQCINPSHIKIINIDAEEASVEKKEVAAETQHLFAFPLESNFSGTRYSENLVLAVQNQTLEFTASSTTPNSTIGGEIDGKIKTKGTWRVLLDAAKACATNPPNLSLYPADFVALSYYKIFGYPTGLGALIIKRDALSMLRKTYFGGGTVLSSSAEERFHALRPGYAGFEDGTLPFLAFPAVLQSFSAWQHRGGFGVAEKVASSAACRFAERLLAVKHSNGSRVATVYGQWNNFNDDTDEMNNKTQKMSSIICGQGPTITFNLLDPQGNWVGHRQVQRIASLEGIYLRTGVMCNPGACSAATGVKAVQAKAWFENGHVCWDDKDVLDGIPTGAVRVSFGWGSSDTDADALVEFVKRHFVWSKLQEGSQTATSMDRENVDENGVPSKLDLEKEKRKHDDLRIHSLTIYPIKSAAGFSPRSWPLSPTSGFLYDRHWAVVNSHGSILTLKKCPQLSSLHPVVYLQDGVMRIHAKGMKEVLEIPLPDTITEEKVTTAEDLPSSTYCISGDANEWLTKALGIPCSLIAYNHNLNSNSTTDVAKSETQQLVKSKNHSSFSNEAQVLLVTMASLQAIYKKSGIESSFEKFTARFRPNIIVEEKYLPPLFSEEEETLESDADDGEVGKKLKKEDFVENTTNQNSLPALAPGLSPTEIIEKEDEMLAFEEEQWTSISLTNPALAQPPPNNATENTSSALPMNSSKNCDNINFEVVGPCPRCEIVCIDPSTGRRQGPEPLLTLAKERKGEGKKRFCFGMLLNAKQSGGDGVVVDDDNSGGEEELERNILTRVAVGMRVEYETILGKNFAKRMS
ncbi:hypothetical protein Ndes2526A_g02336 [Nannochloris sp. 'desiccata']